MIVVHLLGEFENLIVPFGEYLLSLLSIGTRSAACLCPDASGMQLFALGRLDGFSILRLAETLRVAADSIYLGGNTTIKIWHRDSMTMSCAVLID